MSHPQCTWAGHLKRTLKAGDDGQPLVQYAYETLSPADLMAQMPKDVTGGLQERRRCHAASNVADETGQVIRFRYCLSSHAPSSSWSPQQAQRLQIAATACPVRSLLCQGPCAATPPAGSTTAHPAALPPLHALQGCGTTHTAAWPPMCATPGGTASPRRAGGRAATSSPSSLWSSSGPRSGTAGVLCLCGFQLKHEGGSCLPGAMPCPRHPPSCATAVPAGQDGGAAGRARQRACERELAHCSGAAQGWFAH